MADSGKLSARLGIKDGRGYQSRNRCDLFGHSRNCCGSFGTWGSSHTQLFAHTETMENRYTRKKLLLTVLLRRSMFPRPVGPIAKAGTAKNTPNTKSHSTKPARFVFSLLHGVLTSPKSPKRWQLIPSSAFTPRPLQLHKESVGMTGSSLATVGRRNPSSTKKQRLRKRWC